MAFFGVGLEFNKKNILEKEKSMYQGREINERSLINLFQLYGLSRTFSSPPALAEINLLPETTFLLASQPRRTVVTEAFKQGCDLMGRSFTRIMVLVPRSQAWSRGKAGGCETDFKRLL